MYSDSLLAECLKSVGYETLSGSLPAVAKNIQQTRWKARFATGYKPEDMTVPNRFLEITTGKDAMDPAYLASLKDGYARALKDLASYI